MDKTIHVLYKEDTCQWIMGGCEKPSTETVEASFRLDASVIMEIVWDLCSQHAQEMEELLTELKRRRDEDDGQDPEGAHPGATGEQPGGGPPEDPPGG